MTRSKPEGGRRGREKESEEGIQVAGVADAGT